MTLATVTSKGQTTIPKEVRERLNLHSGDRIDFTIHENGEVILRPATFPIAALKGILHRKGIKKIGIEEMNQTIKKRAGQNR